MIPRILPSDPRRGNRETPSAFTRGANERKFHVVVDSDGVAESEAMSILTGFASNPHIDVQFLKPSMVTMHDDDAVIDFEGELRRSSCLCARHNLQALVSWGVPQDWLEHPGISERVIVAMWCQSAICDAFVTESSELLAVARRHYPLANPMTPADALAAVGLVLRLREDYVYREVLGSRWQTQGRDFYALLSLGLLPSFRAWQRHCPFAEDPLEVSPGGLADAVHHRVSRALRSRDRVLGHLFRPPTDSDIDEALFYFDSYLVSLAGAFDAVARIAAFSYGIPKKTPRSWRILEFRQRLLSADPGISPLLVDESPFRDTVDIVFLLRNTVHEQPLIPIAILAEDARIIRYEVAFPSADKRRLLDACGRLGGTETWGVDVSTSNGISFDAHRFVERSVRLVGTQLDRAIQLINVSHFEATSDDLGDLDDQMALKHVLPLAGISEPP